MKPEVEKRIKKTLAKNHACYVLITCDEPNEDGKMQVEMSYAGDASVAAYLLQGAQSIIDEQESFEMPVDHSTNKIQRIN